jgi:hypothetical protein
MHDAHMHSVYEYAGHLDNFGEPASIILAFPFHPQLSMSQSESPTHSETSVRCFRV